MSKLVYIGVNLEKHKHCAEITLLVDSDPVTITANLDRPLELKRSLGRLSKILSTECVCVLWDKYSMMDLDYVFNTCHLDNPIVTYGCTSYVIRDSFKEDHEGYTPWEEAIEDDDRFIVGIDTMDAFASKTAPYVRMVYRDVVLGGE